LDDDIFHVPITFVAVESEESELLLLQEKSKKENNISNKNNLIVFITFVFLSLIIKHEKDTLKHHNNCEKQK
jgi:hypothetical protein